MNKYIEHFRRELDILKQSDNKYIITPFCQAIENLLDVLSEGDYSSYSIPYISKIITNCIESTINFDPLSPITGCDSEWDTIEYEYNILQNKRLTSLFKYPDGKVKYLYAIMWVDKEGSFTGSIEGIKSEQEVNLPFTPKQFKIDVNETESGDYKITDRSQLEAVRKYYKTNF